MPIPARPKIYHIVHIDNLASIIAEGYLWSDSVMMLRPSDTVIGMGTIKTRRLSRPLTSHPGAHVGDFVPFYFCPRSIMLYVIYRANHHELIYRGGQQPIVHLEADLRQVVAWAEDNQKRWAFSLSNAGAYYTKFRSGLDRLDEIDWDAVAASDFRRAEVSEGKQAEFLLEGSFPWSLVERIGIHSHGVASKVADAMRGAGHRPGVEIRREWYY